MAALPKLPDDLDAVRLLRLSIAAFEGGFMMPPAKRDIVLLQGIAEALKPSIASHPRGPKVAPHPSGGLLRMYEAED